MDYELKSISEAGVAEATAKADWYQLLNELGEAESICRDVLAIGPEEQTALRLLGLRPTSAEAQAAFERLKGPLRAALLHQHFAREEREVAARHGPAPASSCAWPGSKCSGSWTTSTTRSRNSFERYFTAES